MKLKQILSLVVMFFSSLMMSAQEESFNETPNEPTKVKAGFLIFESSPSGAQVFITQNGEERYEGDTPFQKKMPYGSYNYRIKKSRYHDEVGVAVVDNTRVVQNIKLRPTFGTLKVTTNPSGAKVTLESDGRSFTSPCEIENIPSGEHYVSIVSPRYSSLRNKVLIQDGQVTPLNATLDARFAQVIINTLPNAKIVINGEQRGTGSFVGDLDEGIYDVEVSLAKHRSVTRKIEVVANQYQTITVDPTPLYGSLDVISTPMYAEVVIDGKSYGTTPTTIENLLVGDYDVVLRKDGYPIQSRKVTITENNLSTLEIELPQGRKITISSDGQGDEVYVDGLKLGVTPLEANLSFGTHKVELRRGTKTVSKQINVPTTGGSNEIQLGFIKPRWASNVTSKQKQVLEKLIKDMVRVEGGPFMMGATSEQGSDADNDEKPAHRVALSSYYIGKYEVTQEQWKAVMGSNPSYFKGAKNPVEVVSWNDCQKFIKKLNQLTGLKFRLPTEAEWEYAARGGNKSKGYKYSGSNNLGDVAWYWNNSSSKTHEVGTKASNELGIYDMSGNVQEWCSDWYGYKYYSSSPSTNPTGPSLDTERVIRGGNWWDNANECRVSFRKDDNPSSPDCYSHTYGLRLACSTEEIEHHRDNTDVNNQKHVLEKLVDDMVKVEGGTFMMGATSEQGSEARDDEKPAHQVTLSYYYIGKYEVTQQLWEYVMKYSGTCADGTTMSAYASGVWLGSYPPSSSFGVGDYYPAYNVSWEDIVNIFIPRLNKITGRTFRLPTEAEWEYAARGGNKSKGYKYSGSNTIGDVAWYYKNSPTIHEVGTKTPNELGLYDMTGNVWEWCSDWYGSSYYSLSPSTNPIGPASGSYRVARGGGWNSYAQGCRVSNRYYYYYGYSRDYCDPDDRHGNLGFRLVML